MTELPAPSHPMECVIPEAFIQRNRQVRNLILDYALGNAIVGLNPFPGGLPLTLLIAAILILKMMRDVGKQWGFIGGQDPLAIVGNLMGGIGAIAIAVITWMTVILLSFLFPVLQIFNISIPLFAFTWVVGQVTAQYYINGHPVAKQSRKRAPETSDLEAKNQ